MVVRSLPLPVLSPSPSATRELRRYLVAPSGRGTMTRKKLKTRATDRQSVGGCHHGCGDDAV